MKGHVYVNRTLNMKKINYIGLDMDHTLIRYKSDNFEALAYKVMIDKLIQSRGYPESIRELKFDYNLAIRGLVIDKSGGNILKLSRHGAIRTSFHGLENIDYKKLKKLYKSTYIDISDSNYDPVDTSFSISFAALFSQLVDLKDDKLSQQLPGYNTIAQDLLYVLDRAHRDGSIKNVVRDNIEDYILKDKSIVEGLERYRKHGKKIFILTNSDYKYTKILLDYAINPLLKEHAHWQEVFEFVITLAQKPRFFYDKLPFLMVNPIDGTMTNVEEKISQGGIYQGGCASILTADLNMEPDEILYIGDHIYGDIVRLKKDCAWRTALVIEELDTEVESINHASGISVKINALMEQKIPLEQKLADLNSLKLEDETSKYDKEIEVLSKEIHDLDMEISPLIKKQQSYFNSRWGEVFRTGIEESYFAYQVERFACIYMAKLSDLFSTSPRTYFRSKKRPLAHEF